MIARHAVAKIPFMPRVTWLQTSLFVGVKWIYLVVQMNEEVCLYIWSGSLLLVYMEDFVVEGGSSSRVWVVSYLVVRPYLLSL